MTNNALQGGQWVTDKRGIQRWRPHTTPTPYCGTERGYQWHRYHQPNNWPLPEHDPCGCRQAHRSHARTTTTQGDNAA